MAYSDRPNKTTTDIISKYEKQMARAYNLNSNTDSGGVQEEVKSSMSRNSSEQTPFRRKRSERKQAWLESASSVCSAIVDSNAAALQ